MVYIHTSLVAAPRHGVEIETEKRMTDRMTGRHTTLLLASHGLNEVIGDPARVPQKNVIFYMCYASCWSTYEWVV